MLTLEEEQFLAYWQNARLHYKKSVWQLIKGLSRGLLIGIGIIVVLSLGWYERANMEANTKFNPLLLLVIIIAIALFVAYFYRQYLWEQKEQQYLELLAKQKKQQVAPASN